MTPVSRPAKMCDVCPSAMILFNSDYIVQPGGLLVEFELWDCHECGYQWMEERFYDSEGRLTEVSESGEMA